MAPGFRPLDPGPASPWHRNYAPFQGIRGEDLDDAADQSATSVSTEHERYTAKRPAKLTDWLYSYI